MTVLVKASRAELVLTPDSTAAAAPLAEINDVQIATEIQLLSSRDILRKVVEQAGFAGKTEVEEEKAVTKLEKNLRIAPLMKSSMIRVRYASPDPELSARVLTYLANVYLERHLQLHSNAGSFAFFQQQAAIYAEKMRAAQQKLLQFQHQSGIVSASEQKDLLLRKLVELGVELRGAEATREETLRRIATLRTQIAEFSPRITTQSRRVPNQYSVERLNTLLAELQNKRTELLTKFRPDDRMVRQVEQQIADTRKAMENAERLNATEEATDVNPTRLAAEGELARNQTTADGLQARIDTLVRQSREYRDQLSKLETVAPEEQDALRDVKVAEDNYLLYSKKREEARIGEAMDKQKIANVAIAEPPRVPAVPLPRLNAAVAGVYLLVNALVIVGALLSGHFRRTVQTPWEVEHFAGLPVLGTVPEFSGLKPVTPARVKRQIP